MAAPAKTLISTEDILALVARSAGPNFLAYAPLAADRIPVDLLDLLGDVVTEEEAETLFDDGPAGEIFPYEAVRLPDAETAHKIARKAAALTEKAVGNRVDTVWVYVDGSCEASL